MTRITYTLILMLLLVSSWVCAGDSLRYKAQQLETYYMATLVSNEYPSAIKKFFELFPDNFSEFNTLYGYFDSAAILYKDYDKHIPKFAGTIHAVGDTAYYRKLFSLGYGGHWDADAINYLQEEVRKRVLADIALTVYTLEQQDAEDIYSFWYFYFDSPHPETRFDEGLHAIEAKSKPVYELLQKAYTKVSSRDDRNVH